MKFLPYKKILDFRELCFLRIKILISQGFQGGNFSLCAWMVKILPLPLHFTILPQSTISDLKIELGKFKKKPLNLSLFLG